MRTYTYRATIEPGDEADWVVSFPDVPEAVTQAETVEGARIAAQEALGLALLSYPARGRPLPQRRQGIATQPSQTSGTSGLDISPAPDVTAKLAVLEAFAASSRTREELAAMLGGKTDLELRSILDPFDPTELPLLAQALEALGQKLVVGVAPIDEAA
ncbi:type II toxin-antitoxin system HicB family antitoxin [Enterovirga sp. CN4-39]|uniref:type II toxin-antitoxin system HicB family antitoxin n=1 Tax=Enterovirga sp. CN4-39 TaxID=3400910 RepID=UPI003C0A5831